MDKKKFLEYQIALGKRQAKCYNIDWLSFVGSGYKYTGYAIGDGYAVQVFTEYPIIDGEPQLPPGWHWT